MLINAISLYPEYVELIPVKGLISLASFSPSPSTLDIAIQRDNTRFLSFAQELLSIY
jgi:hypothetical protein